MKGHIIKSTLFVVICGLLFYAVQGVMTPDFYYNQNVNYSIDSFDNFEKDSIDVVFLGQSQGLLCISPMKLYEDTGICSYNLSTSGQPIELSYHLCKHILKRQSPNVVFLNAGNLFYHNIGFENWRYVMDNMPLNMEKIEMARDFASWPGSDSFLSAIFPLLRYHTRWNELTSDDFQKRETEYYYTAGQFLMNYSWPNDLDEEGMNTAAKSMEERNTAAMLYIEDGGTCVEETIETPLYDMTIPETNVEYLQKIQALCQEAGAELVLTGLPNRIYPMEMIYAWTRDMCETSRSLANVLGIRYFDAAYDVDAGLDYTVDTYDGGTHLNLFGAEKVTMVFEQYLADNFQMESNKNSLWDQMLEEYQGARALASFRNLTNPTDYLAELVHNQGRWSILIAASGEYTAGLMEEELTFFDQLGLRLIREGQWTDSYLAVIQDGHVEYEATSPRRLDYATTVGGFPVSVASAGFFNGAMASVTINGREYAMNQFGLNFVVVDRDTGIVLDSAVVNTGADNALLIHGAGREYFAVYEDEVLLTSNE